MLDKYDEAAEQMRRDHQGHGDEFGHWRCRCGASGGGNGAGVRPNWHRGHDMHLRAEYKKVLAQIEAERAGAGAPACPHPTEKADTAQANTRSTP